MNTENQTDYQRGYQSALDDIADALDRNGDTAAWEWIHANAQSRRTRHIVSHMTSAGNTGEAGTDD